MWFKSETEKQIEQLKKEVDQCKHANLINCAVNALEDHHYEPDFIADILTAIVSYKCDTIRRANGDQVVRTKTGYKIIKF